MTYIDDLTLVERAALRVLRLDCDFEQLAQGRRRIKLDAADIAELAEPELVE